MSEWRDDMENAPEDGCLLYFPSFTRRPVREGYRISQKSMWAWCGWRAKRDLKANQPTKWQPLPEPPTTEEQT